MPGAALWASAAPTPNYPQRLRGAGLAVDLLHQYTITVPGRQALVGGYSLLPEIQARATAAVIALRSLRQHN